MVSSQFPQGSRGSHHGAAMLLWKDFAAIVTYREAIKGIPPPLLIPEVGRNLGAQENQSEGLDLHSALP